MTSGAKRPSAVALRYASALMDLAAEGNVLKDVARDLEELGRMIEGSADLAVLIRSPLVRGAMKEKALGALAEKAKFHKLTKNFLGVLARAARVNILPDIINAFGQELSRRRGEVSVTVETARPMDAGQAKAVAKAIETGLGSQVQLDARVNPEIIGGMIVTVGSRMIDDSVRRKLELLEASMTRSAGKAA